MSHIIDPSICQRLGLSPFICGGGDWLRKHPEENEKEITWVKMMKQQRKAELEQYETRVNENPNDAEALYKLSFFHEAGWVGVPINKDKAEEYRKRAAELGYKDAVDYCKVHYNAWEQARIINTENKEAGKKVAKEVFEKKEEPIGAIEETIFPAVVSIRDNRGVFGTGFFLQGSYFLLSNAHVLPRREILTYATLRDSDENSSDLNVDLPFIRSLESEKIPDIIISIIHPTRPNNIGKCLRLEFTDDECHPDKTTFYVYLNHETGDHEIRYLKPISKDGEYPFIYEQDSSVPQPGCSGAPVIEARRLTNADTLWDFKTVGMVYARSKKDKHLYVVPIRSDFKQVLKIIQLDMKAKKANEFRKAADHFGADSSPYKRSEDISIQMRDLHLRDYEIGVTDLNLEISEELEKLLERGIADITGSAFLVKVQRQHNIHKWRLPTCKFVDLEEDFYNLRTMIYKEKNIILKEGDGLFDLGRFRVDVAGGGESKGKLRYELYVQDNIGKGQKTPEGDHIPSVFAIATVEGRNNVSGQDLVDAFDESIITKKGTKVSHTDINTDDSQKTKKSGKKKMASTNNQNKKMYKKGKGKKAN